MPELDINYVAHLARLELTDAEKQKMATQLHEILAYVEQLNRLNVSEVEPTAHATPLVNVWRADEARPGLDRDRVLQNAPESARDLFIVPKIVE